MQTKTYIKVISLYDLIANNLLIIIATLYHIIILALNYYSIKYLERLIIDFSQYYKQFEEIKFNLEICQIITLFTVVILYFITDMFKYIVNEIRFGIMCISYTIKNIYTLYQLFHYKETYITYNDKQDMGLMFIIIELSYVFSIIFIMIIYIFPLLVYGGFYLEKLINYLKRWTKEYKITFVEQKLVKKIDDV